MCTIVYVIFITKDVFFSLISLKPNQVFFNPGLFYTNGSSRIPGGLTSGDHAHGCEMRRSLFQSASWNIDRLQKRRKPNPFPVCSGERYLTCECPVIREKNLKPAVFEIDFSFFLKYVFSQSGNAFRHSVDLSSNTHIFNLPGNNQ